MVWSGFVECLETDAQQEHHSLDYFFRGATFFRTAVFFFGADLFGGAALLARVFITPSMSSMSAFKLSIDAISFLTFVLFGVAPS